MPIIFGEWLPVPETQCRLPNELIFAVGKWMPVSKGLHCLKPVFGAKAKVKLLKHMRSGALLTAIRCVRLRNGYVVSQVVWQYPVPSYWDEKDLGNGVWQIPEGEDGHAVVLCEGYLDFQNFNELFSLDETQEASEPAKLVYIMIRAIARRHPGIKIADLERIIGSEWSAECELNHVTPSGFYAKPDRYKINRALGRAK